MENVDCKRKELLGENEMTIHTTPNIPEWLLLLRDKLAKFIGDDATKFLERFKAAIKPGANLEKAKAPFLIFILESALGHFDNDKFPECTKVISTVIELYRSGETDLEKFEAATEAAEAAAEAAWSAARAAWSAAGAGWSAARAVAWSAEGAAEYKKFANKLIEILEACK